MSGVELLTPPGLPAPTGYSHVAVVAAPRLVWTSGQVALDADGSVVGAGDWEALTRAVMRNLTRALGAAGATWRDVFKLMYYVVDVGALETVRAVRDELVDVERPPASSLVRVAGLVRPELLIEIEAVAAPPPPPEPATSLQIGETCG